MFYVESTAYQGAAVQSLKADGVNTVGVKPKADKRARLNMIADKIQRGMILFPETGCEELISQMTGFGVEKHDDLMDALTTAVIELLNEENKVGTASWGRHPVMDAWGPGGYMRRRPSSGSWTRISG